jgi:large subunit ribosomal protein L22
MRLVVDKVRHLSADKALAILPHVPKRGAIHVEKSLKAAIEAAKDQNLSLDTLVIQRIWADEGAAMKRVIGHSRGRMSGIMKKYSHLTIVLKGETAGKKTKPAKTTETPEPVVTEEN